MKKALIVFAVLLVSITACNKEDEGPSYTQEELNGTWESLEADEDGCLNQLIITDNSISEATVCDGSKVTMHYETYSFDGRKITAKLMGFDAVFEINELTDSKLVATLKVAGSSTKTEYKKIEK